MIFLFFPLRRSLLVEEDECVGGDGSAIQVVVVPFCGGVFSEVERDIFCGGFRVRRLSVCVCVHLLDVCVFWRGGWGLGAGWSVRRAV